MAESKRSHLNYNQIVRIIEPNTSVLDLGCGDGELLSRLIKEKNVQGRGVDIEEEMIIKCIARGLSIFQGNLDEGLKDYASNSYDYVILNQTLQAIHKPILLVKEMLRVGKKAIISFPNFGYYKLVFQLLLLGRMPVTKDLPYQWYDTPNIHLCTRRDFIDHCRKNSITVLKIIDIINEQKLCRVWPNSRATEVIFIIQS
ncbi:hypothetical protein ES707_20540 [subsurface metagenome]